MNFTNYQNTHTTLPGYNPWKSFYNFGSKENEVRLQKNSFGRIISQNNIFQVNTIRIQYIQYKTKQSKMAYKTEIKNDCVVIRMTYQKDWEQWFLLHSDVHYDNKKCERGMLKIHHDEALEKGAGILDFGDFFDVMGGKYDPRSGKSDIRPEYCKGSYFDAVVNDAASYLQKYKDNIIMIAEGNHEISIQNRQEINLTDRLIEKVNPNIIKGKYTGWIRFQFEHEAGGSRVAKTMYYTHGSGGNSPVTRGVLSTARRQDFIDADILVSGHIHTEFALSRPRMKLNDQGNQVIYEQEHLQLGTYKDSTNGQWENMKGFAPPSLGGRWLRFFYKNGQIQYETFRAK
jgi:hypothetical protein